MATARLTITRAFYPGIGKSMRMVFEIAVIPAQPAIQPGKKMPLVDNAVHQAGPGQQAAFEISLFSEKIDGPAQLFLGVGRLRELHADPRPVTQPGMMMVCPGRQTTQPFGQCFMAAGADNTRGMLEDKCGQRLLIVRLRQQPGRILQLPVAGQDAGGFFLQPDNFFPTEMGRILIGQKTGARAYGSDKPAPVIPCAG